MNMSAASQTCDLQKLQVAPLTVPLFLEGQDAPDERALGLVDHKVLEVQVPDDQVPERRAPEVVPGLLGGPRVRDGTGTRRGGT